ncbi:MAG: phosphoglycerol geranylgeranyltransferase [Sphingobacteriales bacterium]|jgi:phosphoglycerol geranylgeranyltransferase
MSIYQQILKNSQSKKKQLAVLIDPDSYGTDGLLDVVNLCNAHKVDFLFFGGSLLMGNSLDDVLKITKQISDIPTVIFPGSTLQISERADGILFLSLISGRNPEHLIGNHVVAAPLLKHKDIEVISTGYMLIDSGKQTTASYMSQTTPIPANKIPIAVSTAMAGEMLGLKLIFMDGGSGALNAIGKEMISSVKKHIDIPLIIGGGIETVEMAEAAYSAGADLIVVGNAIERDLNLIKSLGQARDAFSQNS